MRVRVERRLAQREYSLLLHGAYLALFSARASRAAVADGWRHSSVDWCALLLCSRLSRMCCYTQQRSRVGRAPGGRSLCG